MKLFDLYEEIRTGRRKRMKETIFMKNNVNSNVIHEMFNFKENFKSNVTQFKRISN